MRKRDVLKELQKICFNYKPSSAYLISEEECLLCWDILDVHMFLPHLARKLSQDVVLTIWLHKEPDGCYKAIDVKIRRC